SRYVTLDEIAQMIKGGAEVKVLDNRSKEDLTSVTLAQIIFEEEKKRSQMPLGVLREIIRHGGEAVAVFYQDKVGNRLSERLEEMKNRTESLRENIEQKVRGVTSLLRGSEEKSPVKEVLAAGQTAVEELRAKGRDVRGPRRSSRRACGARGRRGQVGVPATAGKLGGAEGPLRLRGAACSRGGRGPGRARPRLGRAGGARRIRRRQRAFHRLDRSFPLERTAAFRHGPAAKRGDHCIARPRHLPSGGAGRARRCPGGIRRRGGATRA